MIAWAIGAILALSPGAASADQLAALLSGPEAYAQGVDRVCIPALMRGRPPAEFAATERLRPLPDKLLPNRAAPGDRGWYLPTSDIGLVISWADGSCSVQLLRGDDPKPARDALIVALKARPEGFRPGALERVAGGELLRVGYCEAKRPNPVVVTFVGPLPGIARKPIASSTVFRSHDADPPTCVYTPDNH